MKKLIFISILLFSLSLKAQIYNIDAGIGKDSVRTIVNTDFAYFAELIDTSFVDSLQYLSADYTHSDLLNYLNNNFERLSRYTSTGYYDIQWINTGGTIRNKFNANISGFYPDLINYDTIYSDQTKFLLSRIAYPPSDTYRGAIDVFIDSLVTSGIWSKIDEMQVYAAEDTSSAKKGWKGIADASLYFPSGLHFFKGKGFVQRQTYPSRVGGYINTNYNPTNSTISTLDDMGVSLYVYDPMPDPSIIISQPIASYYIRFSNAWCNPGTWAYPWIRANISQSTSSFPMNVANSTAIHPKGLSTINRSTSTNIQFIRNGSILSSLTNNTSEGIPDTSYFIQSFSSEFKNRVSLFAQHSSLTSTEQGKFKSYFDKYLSNVNGGDLSTKLENTNIESIIDTVFNDDYFYTVDVSGNKVLSMKTDTVMLSLDGGLTYPYRHYFADWQQCEFGKVFSNGNILLSKLNGLFFSSDSLQSIENDTLLHGKCRAGTLADSIYVYHTPSNARYPGAYFRTLVQPEEQTLNGNNMLVWGNYTNIFNGASPVNVYYTTDGGETVKTAYEFGQNPANRDDGTTYGGTTGTLLGNANNDSIAEHVHSINYNPNDTSWYMCIDGGLTRPGHHAIMKGKYNFNTDIWTWEWLSTGVTARLFNMLFELNSDSVLCSSDLDVPRIFRIKISDLNDLSKRRAIYSDDEANYVGAMRRDSNGNILATGLYLPYFYISKDNGDSWTKIDVSNQLFSSYGRLFKADENGYFRTRSQIERSYYVRDLLIRIK